MNLFFNTVYCIIYSIYIYNLIHSSCSVTYLKLRLRGSELACGSKDPVGIRTSKPTSQLPSFISGNLQVLWSHTLVSSHIVLGKGLIRTLEGPTRKDTHYARSICRSNIVLSVLRVVLFGLLHRVSSFWTLSRDYRIRLSDRHELKRWS